MKLVTGLLRILATMAPFVGLMVCVVMFGEILWIGLLSGQWLSQNCDGNTNWFATANRWLIPAFSLAYFFLTLDYMAKPSLTTARQLSLWPTQALAGAFVLRIALLGWNPADVIAVSSLVIVVCVEVSRLSRSELTLKPVAVTAAVLFFSVTAMASLQPIVDDNCSGEGACKQGCTNLVFGGSRWHKPDTAQTATDSNTRAYKCHTWVYIKKNCQGEHDDLTSIVQACKPRPKPLPIAPNPSPNPGGQ